MYQPPDPTAFYSRVYEIVCAIPLGLVMTYGNIALLIPPPTGVDHAGYARIRARWVGGAMAACPDDVPWHRVINAQGGISKRAGFGPQLQRILLEDEGVVFDAHGQLNLKVYGWDPDADWLLDRGLLPPPINLASK